MLAIRISPETLEKVLACEEISPGPRNFILNTIIPNGREYFAIRFYTPKNSRYIAPFTILPSFIFKKVFVYDPDVIEHDWDQIVRKDKNASD